MKQNRGFNTSGGKPRQMPLIILILLLICCCTALFISNLTNTPTDTLIETDIPTITNPSPKITATTKPTTTPTQTPTPTTTSNQTVTPTQAKSPTNTPFAVINGKCIPNDTLWQTGEVKSVIDGDTIVVEISGKEFVVRYIGVNSPESAEDGGVAASNENRDLVLGKTVFLVVDKSEVDRFDRLLRYVIVEDIFVNEYMVRVGMAKAASYPPDTACDSTFKLAQSSAESGLLGMWAATVVDSGSRGGDSLFPTLVAPTQGSSLCNCSIDYNCSDFSTHKQAQACFDSCGGSSAYNWAGLDGDHDGQACESLP